MAGGLLGLLDYFDQKAGREQYGNLLNEYRVAGDPNTPNPGPYALGTPEMNQAQQRMIGGFRGEGGVLSGGPPQDFYMRAAALPGYQGLAQQAQVGQQALERQMQAQQWQEQNLTAAQRAEIEVRQEQQKWDRERREFEWNNPSAYQQFGMKQDAARTGIAYANQGLQNAQFNAQYVPDPNRPGSYMPRPVMPAAPAGYTWTPQGTLTEIPGGQPYQARQAATNVLQGAVNQLADIRSQVRNDGTSGFQMLSGDLQAAQQAFQNSALPIVTKAIMGTRTDAPNESDLNRINAQMMDLTKIFGKRETREKAITMLMEMASQQHGSPLTPEQGVSPYFKTYRSAAGRSKLPEGTTPYNPGGR